jgi:hypothetical protein
VRIQPWTVSALMESIVTLPRPGRPPLGRGFLSCGRRQSVRLLYPMPCGCCSSFPHGDTLRSGPWRASPPTGLRAIFPVTQLSAPRHRTTSSGRLMRTNSPTIVYATKPKRTYRPKRKPAALATDTPRIVTVKSLKQLEREREIRFAKAAAEGEASPEIKAFVDQVLRLPSELFVWHLTRTKPA